MKNFNIEKGIEQLKKTKMTAEEKSIILRNIITPLKNPIQSPWTLYSFKTWVDRNRSVSVAAIVLLVMIVSSANVAFAAKGSLPGDLLYPIKTQVLEPVEGAFAITPAAKAEFDVSIANTRLQEAQALAAQGNLDPTREKEIQTSFNAHVSALSTVLDKLDKINASSSDEIRASFQAAMDSNANALDGIALRTNKSNSRNNIHDNSKSSNLPIFQSPSSSTSIENKTLFANANQSTGFDIAMDARAAGNAINHGKGNDHGHGYKHSFPINDSFKKSSKISASSTIKNRGIQLQKNNSHPLLPTSLYDASTSSVKVEATSELPSQQPHGQYKNVYPPVQNVQSGASQSKPQDGDNSTKPSSNSRPNSVLMNSAGANASAVSGSAHNMAGEVKNIVHGL